MSKRINVYIPEDEVWRDFKKVVGKRYNGIYHTNLGLELQTALINYLADAEVPGYKNLTVTDQPADDTSDENQEHTHKLKKTDQKLCDYIYSNFNEDSEINYELLCKFMVKECGLISPRTHQGHINTLLYLDIIHDVDISDPFTLYYPVVNSIRKYVSPELLGEAD